MPLKRPLDRFLGAHDVVLVPFQGDSVEVPVRMRVVTERVTRRHPGGQHIIQQALRVRATGTAGDDEPGGPDSVGGEALQQLGIPRSNPVRVADSSGVPGRQREIVEGQCDLPGGGRALQRGRRRACRP